MLFKTSIIGMAFAAASVSASCVLENKINADNAEKETRTELCQTMGADRWTFAMDLNAISVPNFDGGNPLAGFQGGTVFTIYDNDCIPRGVYSRPDCETTWTIAEAFLQLTLEITDVNLDAGSGYFKFSYGAGTYQIGENGCDCKDISSGLTGEEACGCSFPVNGDGST